MNKLHVNVSGLQNQSVKTQVKNALDKLDGVNMINVDLGRGSIEVGFNDAASESNIRSCIENVGCKIIS